MLADREVSPLQGEITGPGGMQHVHPKVMEVLVCLARKQGEVVQRDEILNQVWGHQHGTDKALTRCVSELRQALGDEGKNKHFIKTVPKRGYCLIVPVNELERIDVNTHQSPEIKEKPSIAVLPFTNRSGERGQDYFSDGITEDILTELSKFSGLFVIARNSSFSFKNKDVSAQQVSRELGVRYILEGSVRKDGNRVRITAHLTDALYVEQIWADKYDHELEDIFVVQDDVAKQLARVLAVELTGGKDAGPRQKTGNIEAYEYVLRGRELAWLHKRETGTEARRLLSQAIWLDPGYASAYSWLAFAHAIDYVNQWSNDPESSLRLANELANKAVRLDDTNAQAHFVLGECALWFRRKHEIAMDEARLAVGMDPNYSHACLLLGHALHYSGRSEESLEYFDMAMRLDPFYPDLYLHFLAQSYYSLGRFGDCVETLEERLLRNPDSDISRVLLAACYGRLGRIEEAKALWNAALEINNKYSLEDKRRVLPYKNPADFDYFVEGLRMAGITG